MSLSEDSGRAIIGGYDAFDLIEPRMRALPPEVQEYITPSVKASLKAAEKTQRMHNSPLYRMGKFFYNATGLFPQLGEILYSMRNFDSITELWRGRRLDSKAKSLD